MTWSLSDLNTLLASRENLSVTTGDESIVVVNAEGTEARVAVNETQIFVESLLFSQTRIRDSAAFHNAILGAHQEMFPLTAIAVTATAGEQFYVAFGALSTVSNADAVLLTIETLLLSVEGILEFSEAFLG